MALSSGKISSICTGALALAVRLIPFGLLASFGCTRSPEPPADLDSLARTYVRLALALGERDPDSVDFYIGPPSEATLMHTSYPPLAEISRESHALSAKLGAIPHPDSDERLRIASLQAQLTAIETRVRMLAGDRLEFDREAELLFNVQELPDDLAPERHRLRAAISASLPPEPGSTLADRYAAFDGRYLVPRDRLPRVVEAALGACRKRTVEHIALPPGETVQIEYVHNKPWNAFSRYLGNGKSRISINLDFPVTVDRVLELACHEGYPGHHVFNSLRDQSLVRDRAFPEFAIQLTFSPQSFVSEALAAYAPRLAFTTPERAEIERDLLFPLAGLPPPEAERYVLISEQVHALDSAQPEIARRYLDGSLEFVRAQDLLAGETLMEHSEATLLYLNQYRSYMLAYTQGERQVAWELAQPLSAIRSSHAEATSSAWRRYAQIMRSLTVHLSPPSRL